MKSSEPIRASSKQNWEQKAANIQQQQAELLKQFVSLAEQMKQLEERREQEAASVQASEEQRELAKQRRETLTQTLALGTAGITLLTASVNYANAAADKQTPPIVYEQAPHLTVPAKPVSSEWLSRVVPSPDLDYIVQHLDLDDPEVIKELKSVGINLDPSDFDPLTLYEEVVLKLEAAMDPAERDALLKQDIVGLLEKHPDSPLKHRVLGLLKTYYPDPT